MPYVKSRSYRDMPFSSLTPTGDFYTYSSVADLTAKSEMHKEDIFRCRTIGILQSLHGRFYLTDIDLPSINLKHPVIRVSLRYLQSPPQSTVMPYPVQIFGTLQWKHEAVIFAKILLVMNTPMAIRVRDSMNAVTKQHLANNTSTDSGHPSNECTT